MRPSQAEVRARERKGQSAPALEQGPSRGRRDGMREKRQPGGRTTTHPGVRGMWRQLGIGARNGLCRRNEIRTYVDDNGKMKL